MLIRSKLASKFELHEYYTLDEALKLYALLRMQSDIEDAQIEDMRSKTKR